MMEYIEISLPVADTVVRELLVARLSDIGFTGFEEDDLQVKAFIGRPDFKEAVLRELTEAFGIAYAQSCMKEHN